MRPRTNAVQNGTACAKRIAFAMVACSWFVVVGACHATKAPLPRFEVALPRARPLPPETLSTYVELLAEEEEGVTTPRIGDSPTLNRTWVAFERVIARASPSDLRTLLSHPSPVVRTFVAQHVLVAQPEDTPFLEPLLDDTTSIQIMDGCSLGTWTVGERVAERICTFAPTNPLAEQLRSRASRSARVDSVRSRLATCQDGEAAAALVLARRDLRSRDSWKRADAVRSIGRVGDDSDAARVARVVRDSDADVRLAAAEVLPRWSADVATNALFVLLSDPLPEVRRKAAFARAAISGADASNVCQLLTDRSLASPESESGRMAFAMLHAAPRDEWLELFARDVRPYQTGLFRSLLSSPDRELRRLAVDYLARIDDRASAPRIIALLRSDEVLDRCVAALAVGVLGRHDEVPALIELLADPDEYVRVAAATALGDLEASEAAPAVTAARDRASAAPAATMDLLLSRIPLPAEP